MSDDRTFPIAELFGPTMQGEGACAGKRTMFVRVGGCDFRCSWCDSMHAVDPKHRKDWKRMSVEAIMESLRLLGPTCKTVTLTGGNPVLFDLQPLVLALMREGYEMWVETQGSVYKPWTEWCNVTLSPKPPSAVKAYSWAALDQFLAHRAQSRHAFGPGGAPRTAIKVPIDPDRQIDGVYPDLEFAREAFSWSLAYPWIERYLSVVTYPNDDDDELLARWRRVVDFAMTLPMDVGALPQLHVLVWGHRLGV